MLRFLIALPLFFLLCVSSGCFFCKQPRDCQEPDGSGVTKIHLEVPLSYDLKWKEAPSVRFSLSAKGETLECSNQFEPKDCKGTVYDKRVHFADAGQRIYIEVGFAYKEMDVLVQHNGTILFNGVIDFTKKPNEFIATVSPDCTFCWFRGTAYVTATLGD